MITKLRDVGTLTTNMTVTTSKQCDKNSGDMHYVVGLRRSHIFQHRCYHLRHIVLIIAHAFVMSLFP